MTRAYAFHAIQTTGDTAPEWIHLLPSGTFKGSDGRGPYVLRDPQGVIKTSMERGHGKLALDENHATDTAAKIGLPAHAMGWIVQLENRADGIWGRVDWTPPGKQAWANRAYRGISPVFKHTADGVVTHIVRASLTNDPNLTLNSLHHKEQETKMELKAIALALGLPETATQADVDRALAGARMSAALHSSLSSLLGLGENADAAAITTGVRARLEGETTTAQALHAVQAEVATLRQNAAQTAAERAVDDAARNGHVISKDLRTDLIALHAANPEQAMRIIGQLPKIQQGQVAQKPAAHSAQSAATGEQDADPKVLASLDAVFAVTAEERAKFGGGNAQ